MAWVRCRRRKTGRYYYVIVSGRTFAAGRNRRAAEKICDKYDELERLDRHGIASPTKSSWRLSDLKARDVAAHPEPSRARRWRQLERWFGADLPIDEITHAALEEYRKRGPGPATINRDLSVLSSALKTARRLREASGYNLDPFAGLPPLDEKGARRPSIALTAGQVADLLKLFHGPMAAAVRLLLLTASRPGQRGIVRDGMLYFPSHKRGEPRSFRVDRELAAVLAAGPRWSRRAWRRQIKKFARPDLRPHDLRHTAATLLFQAGAQVSDVQEILGHKTPAMAQQLYIHVRPKAIKTVPLGPPMGHPSRPHGRRQRRPRRS